MADTDTEIIAKIAGGVSGLNAHAWDRLTGGDEEASRKLYAGMDPMTADDLAELFWWLANLPARLNVNTIELMPVSQSFAGFTVSRD